MFNHILTSVKGSHTNNQDAIKFFENDGRIIAVVSDGLGSRKSSAYGARLICKLILNEMKTKKIPCHTNDIESIRLWYEQLNIEGLNADTCCTTSSFVVIDKEHKIVSCGQIGDSPIFVGVDGCPIKRICIEKDFSNMTECIGGRDVKQFEMRHYSYDSSVKVLVTSDGIGDELNNETLPSLFTYLSLKYEVLPKKSRSRIFTKEVKATFGKVNNDDKSAIFIWSL